jgi:hypothetical protein
MVRILRKYQQLLNQLHSRHLASQQTQSKSMIIASEAVDAACLQEIFISLSYSPSTAFVVRPF